MSQKIIFIQPRHIYAPNPLEEKKGHIYMPTSLLTADAIFQEMGFETEIYDENISPADINSNIIGINLLGAPYIPVAIEWIKKLEQKFKSDYTLLLGGQIISGLTVDQHNKLFSQNTYNGNSPKVISKLFNIQQHKIPQPEKVSLIKSYEKIKPKDFAVYLQHEFAFYLSQGCKHSCSFCSAKRTRIENGIIHRTKETYRDLSVIKNDLEYLIKSALNFNIHTLRIYLSNLDLFQTPDKLFEFSSIVEQLKLKHPTISIKMRGLATCRSFLNMHKKHPHIIKHITNAGLYQIGFGVDGATPKVYKETRKPQTVQESLDTIKICKTIYNITPETLMVFGHNNKEDELSLQLAVKFCKDMQIKYNALPRPHIAKDIVPGNDGWCDEKNSDVINTFINTPSLFQHLDFTATPSPITHPNKKFRELVSKYYKEVCDLPNSLTEYTLPETEKDKRKTQQHNMKRYDI